MLSRVKDIQTMYKVFGQYVAPEDLHNLYKVKFDLLGTEAIYSGQGQNIDEHNFYIKLTEERLEKILKGQNKNFEDCYGENQSKATSMLRDIIKSECYEFSGKAIFSSRRILGFILAFDTEDGYKDFLRAPHFSHEKLGIRLDESYLSWDKNIPLQTIYQLFMLESEDFNENAERWMQLIMLSPKLLGYCDLNKASERRESRLPEGISHIYSTRIDNHRYNYRYGTAILNILGKKVVLPSSVRRIAGFIPDLKSIELNKELLGISEEAIKEAENKSLNIRIPVESKSVKILENWFFRYRVKHEIDTCHPAFRRDKDGATITLGELDKLIHELDKQEEPDDKKKKIVEVVVFDSYSGKGSRYYLNTEER